MARADLSKEGNDAASNCDGAGRGEVRLATFTINIGRGKPSKNLACNSRCWVAWAVVHLKLMAAGCEFKLCAAATLMANKLLAGFKEVAIDLGIERRREVQEAGPVDAEANVLLAARFEYKPL